MFFKIHDGLPREGPGSAADVTWAVELADLPQAPVICDLACGPGGDFPALAAAAPSATLIGIEKRPDFVATATARVGARATIREGDMAEIDRVPEAPFDMIWCAGALYFLGLDTGLATMKRALRPGGVLAFSEPCFFTDAPSEPAREFWEGYPTQTVSRITAAVKRAGFTPLATRPVADDGWEAYYQPIEARVAEMLPGADARLRAACEHELAEAARWRQGKRETGYLLVVARA